MSTRDPDSTASMQRESPAKKPAPAAVVRVVHPRDLRARQVLSKDPLCAGREGDLVIDHRTVSRRHAVLAWDPSLGAHTARDLGSRNGSAVDGEALKEDPTPLRDQAVLRLGDVLAVYERAGGEDAEDAPEVSREAAPGDSIAMRRLRRAIGRAAIDRSAVLIAGETGTGKERLAAEIHRLSGRTGAFVAVNCAAINPQLAESALFGHARGAFTGATDAQRGLIREADGGTLFLDEVGELPEALQPKLLRALQEREILPVGTSKPVRVDVRVVSATHRDLTASGASGFRRDLYARLSLWEVRVPPLRARRADLFTWIEVLQRAWDRGRSAPPLALSPSAAEALLLAPWTLNLRAVERLIREVLAEGRGDHPLALADLPDWVRGSPALGPEAAEAPPPGPDTPCRPAVPTKDEFTEVFHRLGGSVRALARHYSRDRRQIYRWVEAFGLDPDRR